MMGNVLKMDKQQVIQGLIRLGWSDRAIHKESGIHRKTISAYRKQFQNAPQVPTDLKGTEIQNVPQVPTDSAGGESAPIVPTDVLAVQSRPIVPADYEPPLPSTKSRIIDPIREIIRRLLR